MRPADPEETAGAFAAAAQRIDGPTLARADAPGGADLERHRCANCGAKAWRKGGYIAKRETAELDLILLSCGSELQHALAAAKELGDGTRVVSMPCFERFERQSAEYREEVIPSACRRRVAIEAGVTGLWYQYVGLDGKVVGMDRFGLSAPGDQVMKELGIDAQHVIDAARSL